ncbi:hypothetical protein [Spirosoma arboris]|uniref:hypothetical protein n=1 Tax=Spirosoma arboris TaxID=2682092 RepID=UPI0018DC6D9B|nr:hypothetical protein [Spirosoma arboris]
MKKQPEKQPIDDLFARKLGNMSLPPSADGFARLQARMGQGKQETKIVFWRNPEMQRYMAAAACLLLVCLFGWLYWPSGDKSTIDGVQIATNQKGKSASTEKRSAQKKASLKQPIQPIDNQSIDNEINPVMPDKDVAEEQLADINKGSVISKQNRDLANPSVEIHKPTRKALPLSTNEPVLAQTNPNPVNAKAKPETVKQDVVQPIVQSSTEQVAETKPITKSAPSAERVLVVTIAEPEALVAARQAAKNAVEEQSVVASTDKPEKETKMGGLWQQVKRIKQGEVFARQDSPNDDERGLLGRAYNGLKHSLDKDKSTKQ